MHFPGFLSSLLNEPLGILGVVFPSTQTRFILPYEASLTFRNPFLFQASSPHVLAAHAVAFNSWLPSEGPTTDFHCRVHHHVQRTRLRSARYARLRSASPRRGQDGGKKNKLQKQFYTGIKTNRTAVPGFIRPR